jgi:hypothetical protein
MYQELAGGLLLRGQEQERDRLRKQIGRLRELERGDTTAPGWRSPAPGVRRGPEPARERPRGPFLQQWIEAKRPAGANV